MNDYRPIDSDAHALRAAPLEQTEKVYRVTEHLSVGMCQLDPASLTPLVGHPTLRRKTWGLCSDSKKAEAWELFPLGDPPWTYDRWKERQSRRTKSQRP